VSLPDEILVCSSEQLTDSSDGVRFEVTIAGQRQPAFAVRYAGRVHAYVNRCAHIAYELDFQPGKFFDSEGLLLICSTHGALYAPENGSCAGGPCARRSLIRVPVEERDGRVYARSPAAEDENARRRLPRPPT
jgi:nitrite reductase/ring-hydroxylating ferredoxin subunit